MPNKNQIKHAIDRTYLSNTNHARVHTTVCRAAGKRSAYYPQILPTALRILQGVDFQANETRSALPSVFSFIFEKLATAPNIPLDPDQLYSPEPLLSRLSFSHFIELIRADTPLKRSFYEVQSIKNNWSIRELGGPSIPLWVTY